MLFSASSAAGEFWLRPAVDSLSGDGLYVEAPSNGSLVVNGTEAEVVDIFASNGQYPAHEYQVVRSKLTRQV